MKSRRSKRPLLLVAALIGVIILALLASGIPQGHLASPSPTFTPTPAPTATPTFAPSPTVTPVPTFTPTSVPPEPYHLWFDRPIGPQGEQKVERFYPYGSTGAGKYRIHHGVEFINPEGTPVLAAAPGRVIVAGRDDEVVYGAMANFYGQLVVIETDKEYGGKKVYNLYGHLSEIEVKVGQRVEEGEVIGRVGRTGRAFGPHLHFEVRVGENSYEASRNPELWLRPLPGRGIIAGRLVDAQGKPIPQALITIHLRESPDRLYQEIYTYPREEVNSDEYWGENFVLGDVPEGAYILRTRVGEKLYQVGVVVAAGKMSFVDLRTE